MDVWLPPSHTHIEKYDSTSHIDFSLCVLGLALSISPTRGFVSRKSRLSRAAPHALSLPHSHKLGTLECTSRVCVNGAPTGPLKKAGKSGKLGEAPLTGAVLTLWLKGGGGKSRQTQPHRRFSLKTRRHTPQDYAGGRKKGWLPVLRLQAPLAVSLLLPLCFVTKKIFSNVDFHSLKFSLSFSLHFLSPSQKETGPCRCHIVHPEMSPVNPFSLPHVYNMETKKT